ncbi:hypothetical protein AGDE_15963 [Angomonas deanei]|uniref:Protein phosphatase 2C, putative n=1 Tax=Angomonas deanei TaxID=59799 RepID=A0A7G2CPZ0_9TRYP|nr:hypothetical protein AGDE_15963 [Angomonas deanei]CAD2221840.1 Protein phosphatase 2C, putative [Angomonas deanei]|eukprot:EPY18054.1 hypothetical protein AGDE_15963 [Angomonas deanei]
MSSSTLRSRPRGGTVRFGTKEQFLESRVLHRASEEVSFVDTTIQCIGEGVSTPNCISVGGWCQGWRKEMEDEQVSVSGRQNNSGICVTVLFDGHRGSQAAQFVSKKLPQRIIRAVQSTPFTLAPRKKPKHKAVKRTEKEFQDRYKHIVQSFYEIDRELYKEQETHAKGIQLTDVLDPPFDFGDDFKCTSPKYPENRSRRSYSHSSYLEADFSKQRRLSTSGGFTIMGPEPDDDVVKLDEDIPIENGSVTEVAEIKVEVKMSEDG